MSWKQVGFGGLGWIWEPNLAGGQMQASYMESVCCSPSLRSVQTKACEFTHTLGSRETGSSSEFLEGSVNDELGFTVGPCWCQEAALTLHVLQSRPALQALTSLSKLGPHVREACSGPDA